jgi:hypothetical protein
VFSNQKSKFGYTYIFLKALEWKIMVYFKAIGILYVRPFGVCYGHLVYVMAVWCMLWPCGIFFPTLVSCTKKNLATLPYLQALGLYFYGIGNVTTGF